MLGENLKQLIHTLNQSTQMHYEYEHAGLERSHPKQSEQHSIRGIDIRAVLDRSGYGNNRSLDTNQDPKNRSQESGQLDAYQRQKNQNFNALRSAEVKGNQPVGNFGAIKSDMAFHPGMEDSSSRRQKEGSQYYPFASGNEQSAMKNLQQMQPYQEARIKKTISSQIRSSEYDYGRSKELENSQVRRYDQSSLRKNGESVITGQRPMKGSEFGKVNSSGYGGVMQGSSFGRGYEQPFDSRNNKSGFKGDSYSFNQNGGEDLKPFEYANGQSSFRLSQSSRMQQSNMNKPGSNPKPENKGSMGEFLTSFNNEHGYYNTIDLINFLTHYSIGEEAEDKFLQQQIFRNMRTSFTQKYVPEQLERLATQGRYISPENNYIDEHQRKTLFNIYLEYLKDNGREYQLSNQQKYEQFERVLNTLR